MKTTEVAAHELVAGDVIMSPTGDLFEVIEAGFLRKPNGTPVAYTGGDGLGTTGVFGVTWLAAGKTETIQTHPLQKFERVNGARLSVVK